MAPRTYGTQQQKMLRNICSLSYVRRIVRFAQPHAIQRCAVIANRVKFGSHNLHPATGKLHTRFFATDLHQDLDTSKPTEHGKQCFDCNMYTEAELVLRKAAENNDSEAQFQLGLLLSTPTTARKGAAPKALSSTAAEVKNEIKKLRKESLMAKQVQSGSVAAFQNALSKRKELSLDSIKVEHSTAKQRKGIEIAGQAREKEGLKWMGAAAEQRHTNAMCFLGNHMLANAQTQLNDLVTQDRPVQSVQNTKDQACKLITEAIDHYERAAQLKNATAAFNLGVLYHDGITCDMPATTGTQQVTSNHAGSVEDAHVVGSCTLPEITVSKVSNRHKRTAALDEPGAAQSKPVKVDIVSVDLTLSLQYFEHAAALHEPTAALWCGYCYVNAEGGVEPHSVSGGRAVSYLTAAADHSDTSAKAHFYLSQVYRSGCAGSESTGSDAVAPRIGMFVQHLQVAAAGQDEDALNCLADLHLQQFVALSNAEEHAMKNSDELSTIEVQTLLERDLHAGVDASACHHHEGCGHDHRHDRQGHRDNHKHLHRAVSLFERASAAGQATATLTLGALTYQGIIHTMQGMTI